MSKQGIGMSIADQGPSASLSSAKTSVTVTNIAINADVFQTGGSFLPNEISGMTLWLRSDKGISLDGSNNVQSWADQSGSGNNVSQVLGARPTYNLTGAPKSLPSVSNSNGGQGLVGTGTLGTVTAVSLIAVFKTTSLAAFQIPFHMGSGNDGFAMSIDGASTSKREVWFPNIAFNADGNATTNWEIWSLTGNTGPTQLLQINGVNQSIPSSSATAALAQLGVLADSGSGAPLQGDMAEAIAYNHVLSVSDMQNVTRYLGLRYGISVP